MTNTFPRLRIFASLLLVSHVGACAVAPAVAVSPVPTALGAADSARVGRILLAEDRRDTLDTALGEGVRHADGRVRALATRALARIRDPKYAARDSAAPPSMPPTWPEPSWRLRYRALATRKDDCAALRAGLADSVWAVRLRAADLIAPSCAGDSAIVATLRAWIAALPADASVRQRGGVSWHAGAHAVVAMARLRPGDARPVARALSRHSRWQVRAYAARAATVLGDSATLRALAHDAHANVREAAIEGLAKVAPGDTLAMIAALTDSAPQVVRAAAVALKGGASADVRAAASRAFERWVARGSASERDVRVALLAAAGRPAGEDRPPAPRGELPPRAVALALGDTVMLRVRMSAASGGGSFVVRLRGDVAPMMAARILALARRGYYDGLTWHRVEHDFVIQGGSPGENEYVGLPAYLRDELGRVPHARGTVGMSTRGHDTGDGQWFVNLKDNLRLGADYTVFAEVVEGMEVVDDVMEGDVIERIEEVQRPSRSHTG